jgi:fumarate hydratase subunit beta
MEKKLTTPISDAVRKSLRAGDEVLISGVIYTARDAAHKIMVEDLKNNIPLPFEIKNQVIYYVGPTPAKPGQAIGSAGPTSSYRMDTYSPTLMAKGLKVMIGKGERTKPFTEEVKSFEAVYLAAIGGIGALLSKTVKKSEVVAYPDLQSEAIRRLEVVDFPAIVAIDSLGNSIYTK